MITLKQYLCQHIFQYSEKNLLELSEEEIVEDLEVLIERISAPVSLGGLSQIIKMIKEIKHFSSVSAENILRELHLAPYIFSALDDHGFYIDDKILEAEYYRITYHKGWCSEHPFYVLLLKSYQYQLTQKSCQLLAAFIKHYYVVLDTLRDPELATTSSTREEEACSNLRLFMKSTGQDFIEFHQTIPFSDKDTPEFIAFQIEEYLESKDNWFYSVHKNYLRVLLHFFSNDWKSPKSFIRKPSIIDREPKRYVDPKALPIVGAQEDIFALIPDKPLTPNGDGLDEDDQFESQKFVVNNRDLTTKRDKTELLDIDIPFNKNIQARIAIDVTANVRRSHNMGMQNTQLLMPEELNFLVSTLIANGKKQSNLDVVITIWLMLLLSKTIAEIQNLYVFTDLSKKRQGLYIDENGQGWWHFFVLHSAKSRMEHFGLRKIKEEVFTSCPDFLLKIIRANFGKNTVGPIINEKNIEVLTNKITLKLKKMSDSHSSGRISITRLVNFISYYLNSTEIIDPIYIDYSYAVQMYTTRVARSYANVCDHHRCKQLNKLWLNVEEDILRYSCKPLPIRFFDLRYYSTINHFMGSSFTPTNEAITKLISALSQRISASKPSFHHKLESIIDYHNAFTAYTAWMLLFGTGYRAAWNPLPTLALFLPSFNLMGISDKDDSDFTHSRIVAVPNVLKIQLVEYKRHLGCLRSLLRILMPKICSSLDKIVDVAQNVLGFNHSQASQWYKIIRNSRKEQGPFFFFHKQRSSTVVKNLSPSELVGYCRREIVLPANAGRHWLKSKLLDKNVNTELINFQMGHWQTGEVPLGDYSALSHVEAINEILPTLNELFKEVGWVPIKSVLS